MANSEEMLKAEELYNKGNTNAKSGMFEVALSMYDQAISLDRSNPMYFNNRAATLKRLGRVQDALNQYEQIANEFPEYGKVFLSMGSTNIEIGNYESAVLAYQKFYTAFKEGKFTFNPIFGGVNQAVQKGNLLQEAFLTSINYLSPKQQNLASQAFKEAITEPEKNSKDIGSDFVSEKDKSGPVIDLRNSGKIYSSFLYNFYYRKGGIKIHLRKLQGYNNSWDCTLTFEREKISKKINIPSWDNFLSLYTDSFFQNAPYYQEYKSQIHSISYDLKIIMEIKASLVMFAKTSSYDFYKLVNFNDPINKYVRFDSFDPLVDDIINSVPSSFWDEIINNQKFPTFSSDNIGSLTSAFVKMFSTGYSDFGKYLTNSMILKTLSCF